MRRAKVGADDYITKNGATAADLNDLPREVLHQTVERDGDDWMVPTPQHRVECRFSAIDVDSRGRVDCELTVTHKGTDLHWGKLTLASGQGREAVVKKLSSYGGLQKIPWRTILERACWAVNREMGKPEPAVVLNAQLRPPGTRLAVWPVVEASGVTVLFGDGDNGKGWVTLLCCVAARTGRTLPGGFRGDPRRVGPVMYLDYEAERVDLEHRLALLGTGLGMDLNGLLHYRRMTQPIAQAMRWLRPEIQKLGCVLVALDSLVPAAGDEPEGADAARRSISALRTLTIPSLVVAHISGASAGLAGPARPFGSVFNRNLPRSAWEVKRAEDEQRGVLRLGLYQRKLNEGVQARPFGLTLSFTPLGEEAIQVTVARLALGESEVLVQKLPSVRQRIIALLTVSALTTEEIVVRANLKNVAAALKTLQRYAKDGLVVKLSGGKGTGDHVTWALASRRPDQPEAEAATAGAEPPFRLSRGSPDPSKEGGHPPFPYGEPNVHLATGPPSEKEGWRPGARPALPARAPDDPRVPHPRGGRGDAGGLEEDRPPAGREGPDDAVLAARAAEPPLPAGPAGDLAPEPRARPIGRPVSPQISTWLRRAQRGIRGDGHLRRQSISLGV